MDLLAKFNHTYRKTLPHVDLQHLRSNEPDVSWKKGDDGRFSCQMEFPGMRTTGAIKTRQDGISDWVTHGLLRDGPRIYAPSVNESLSLSKVELKVPLSSYRQPFETFVVVPGIDSTAPGEYSGTDWIIGRLKLFGDRWLFSYMIQKGLEAYFCMYHWPAVHDSSIPGAEETIEQHVFSANQNSDSDYLDDGAIFGRRLFINAALLLTNFGAKRIGAAEPGRESELLAAVRSGNRAARRAACAELKVMPTVYGIDQNVRIYETEGEPHAPGDGTRTVSPHWRRGHWARQPHGTGGSLRKLIFRPATLVHADQFGADGTSTVTMRT